MRAGFSDDFLAGAGVEADGDLVAHGAGGDEYGCFAGEDLGGASFEAVDGGVFAVDVVAYLGGGHGGAHLWSGLGEGVAAQVDVGLRGIFLYGRIGHASIFADWGGSVTSEAKAS